DARQASTGFREALDQASGNRITPDSEDNRHLSRRSLCRNSAGRAYHIYQIDFLSFQTPGCVLGHLRIPIALQITNFQLEVLALFERKRTQPIFQSVNHGVEATSFENDAYTIDLGLLCLGEKNKSERQNR